MENVTFKSKMDRPFKIMISVLMCILVFPLLLVLVTDDELTNIDMALMFGCFLFTAGLILWLTLDITYVFKEDHLYLRAGFLYTRIRYKDIESYRPIQHFADIITGFNLLSSSKAIEILAQSVMLGAVKVSPTDQEGFIEELEKRMKMSK